MGYVLIFLTVFASSVKSYCSKQISNTIETTRDAIRLNIIRNALCCSISALIFFFNGQNSFFDFSPAEFCICLISGSSMAVFVVCWTLAMKTDAYMLVSACGSGSFIIPCIFGLFLLNERFTLFKFISFAMMIVALYFLLRYHVSIKGKIQKLQIFLLALILVSQGLNQTMQKLYAHYIPDKGANAYMLYSFMFTTVLLFLFQGFFKAPPDTEQRHLIKGNMKYVILMTLGLFGSSYFQTLAAARVEAILLYPMVNALSLIAGSILASLFYKERMSRDSIIGIVFVLAALIFSKI